MRPLKLSRLALILGVILFILACRTAQTIAELRPDPTNTRPRPTRTGTRRLTRIANEGKNAAVTPTAIVAATDAPPPPTDAPAQPTDEQPQATRASTKRPATARPQATQRPTNTPVPPPTVPQFPYRIKESRCGPNVRTFIEGFVYEGSVGKNDLLVRISQGPDGQPDPNDDFRTGSDSSKGKGYYFQNINIGAPHGGTWYIWVIDPATMKRISDIAIVKTDSERVEDNGTSSGSCQSAKVDFTTQPPPATPRPTNTRQPGNTPQPTTGTNPTPQPSATQDPLNDSDSGPTPTDDPLNDSK